MITGYSLYRRIENRDIMIRKSCGPLKRGLFLYNHLTILDDNVTLALDLTHIFDILSTCQKPY